MEIFDYESHDQNTKENIRLDKNLWNKTLMRKYSGHHFLKSFKEIENLFLCILYNFISCSPINFRVYVYTQQPNVNGQSCCELKGKTLNDSQIDTTKNCKVTNATSDTSKESTLE